MAGISEDVLIKAIKEVSYCHSRAWFSCGTGDVSDQIFYIGRRCVHGCNLAEFALVR